MRKLLISRSKNNESLRRLVKLNINIDFMEHQSFYGAFERKKLINTQRHNWILRSIQTFMKDIVRTVVSKHKFNFSLKAINMLTTASLILKKMPVESLK